MGNTTWIVFIVMVLGFSCSNNKSPKSQYVYKFGEVERRFTLNRLSELWSAAIKNEEGAVFRIKERFPSSKNGQTVTKWSSINLPFEDKYQSQVLETKNTNIPGAFVHRKINKTFIWGFIDSTNLDTLLNLKMDFEFGQLRTDSEQTWVLKSIKHRLKYLNKESLQAEFRSIIDYELNQYKGTKELFNVESKVIYSLDIRTNDGGISQSTNSFEYVYEDNFIDRNFYSNKSLKDDFFDISDKVFKKKLLSEFFNRNAISFFQEGEKFKNKISVK